MATLTLFVIVGFLAVVAQGEEPGNSLYTVTEEAWFDFKVADLDGTGQDYTGRVVIGLFGEVAPMTVLNFVALAKGYSRKHTLLHYKNTKVHRVVQDFVLQMGDITKGDGSGGLSIFGEKFNDEDFILSHRAPGMVSMANSGRDTNASQFFILIQKARWLDGKHVVFGKVIRGMDKIRVFGDVPSDPDTAVPKKTITITDSGVVGIKTKYSLTDSQIDSHEDV